MLKGQFSRALCSPFTYSCLAQTGEIQWGPTIGINSDACSPQKHEENFFFTFKTKDGSTVVMFDLFVLGL